MDKKDVARNINILLFVILGYYIGTIITQFGGSIGVLLDRNKQGDVYIKRVEKGLPADKAGLLSNDYVISVNNEDVSQKRPKDVASKIKGKPGTEVNILIRRDNEVKTYKITREQRKINWLFFLGL